MKDIEYDNRSIEVILAALSVKEVGYEFNPVQVQKLVFLLEDQAGKELGIQNKFNFLPCSYGPFDKQVYNLLGVASNQNLAKILPRDKKVGHRRFILTAEGHSYGQKILNQLDEKVRRFVNELVLWVTERTFQDLIRTIFAEYPAMKVNSIFG